MKILKSLYMSILMHDYLNDYENDWLGMFLLIGS
jgi:hypothetical protein